MSKSGKGAKLEAKKLGMKKAAPTVAARKTVAPPKKAALKKAASAAPAVVKRARFAPEEDADNDVDDDAGGSDDDAGSSDEEEDAPDWGAFCEAQGVDRRLLKGILALEWARPTLVQRAAIPVALQGTDVLIRARTGSGKTACYAIPVLNAVLRRKLDEAPAEHGVRALVLCPTRELVAQARRNLLSIASYARDDVAVLALMGESSSDDAGASPRRSPTVSSSNSVGV